MKRQISTAARLAVALVMGWMMTAAGFAQTKAADARNPEQLWFYGRPLYEVYVRSFSPEGTLQGVTDRLDELQRLGVENLWLMPIYPVGRKGRKGTAGSPYSVRDYLAVDSAYGTDRDFKHLVEEVHARGMHIILDVVMNHSSNDNVQMVKHPDWFMHDSTGAFTREVADWSDVTDWNYDNPGARQYLMDVLLYWVREFDVDGYRCDVAGMVPDDFWMVAIAELRKLKPDIFMLAEWEDESILETGFDAAYDWTLYHRMVDESNGSVSLDSLWRSVEIKERIYPKGTLPLRFVENHDEKRSAEVFGWPGVKPYATLIFTLPGIPLLYNGQEIGATHRPSLFEKEPIIWDDINPEALVFYQELLAMRNGSDILQKGDLTRVNVDVPEVLMFTRSLGSDTVMVAINFSPEPQTVHLSGLYTQVSWVEMTGAAAEGGEKLQFIELAPRASRMWITEREQK